MGTSASVLVEPSTGNREMVFLFSIESQQSGKTRYSCSRTNPSARRRCWSWWRSIRQLQNCQLADAMFVSVYAISTLTHFRRPRKRHCVAQIFP